MEIREIEHCTCDDCGVIIEIPSPRFRWCQWCYDDIATQDELANGPDA